VTLDRNTQLQALLAEIDAVLLAEDGDRGGAARPLLEQVRSTLNGWVQSDLTAIAADRPEFRSALLGAVEQEVQDLRDRTLTPMESELGELRQQQQALAREISTLEQQRQYYQSLAQQQANQEQLIGDFLGQLRERLEASVTEQVLQMLAAVEPRDRGSVLDAQQLEALQSRSDTVLTQLQGTLDTIFKALQANAQRYESALNASLERIHVLGQESEAILEHWLNRLAATLDDEAFPEEYGDRYAIAGETTGATPLPYPGVEVPPDASPLSDDDNPFQLGDLDLSDLSYGVPAATLGPVATGPVAAPPAAADDLDFAHLSADGPGVAPSAALGAVERGEGSEEDATVIQHIDPNWEPAALPDPAELFPPTAAAVPADPLSQEEVRDWDALDGPGAAALPDEAPALPDMASFEANLDADFADTDLSGFEPPDLDAIAADPPSGIFDAVAQGREIEIPEPVSGPPTLLQGGEMGPLTVLQDDDLDIAVPDFEIGEVPVAEAATWDDPTAGAIADPLMATDESAPLLGGQGADDLGLGAFGEEDSADAAIDGMPEFEGDVDLDPSAIAQAESMAESEWSASAPAFGLPLGMGSDDEPTVGTLADGVTFSREDRAADEAAIAASLAGLIGSEGLTLEPDGATAADLDDDFGEDIDAAPAGEVEPDGFEPEIPGAQGETEADDWGLGALGEDAATDDLAADDAGIGIHGLAADEFSTDDLATDDLDSGEFSTGDLGIDDLDSDELSTDDLAMGDLDSGEFETGDLGIDDLNSDELSTDDLATADLDSGEFETDDLDSDEFATDDLATGNLGSDEFETDDSAMADLGLDGRVTDDLDLDELAASALAAAGLGADGTDIDTEVASDAEFFGLDGGESEDFATEDLGSGDLDGLEDGMVAPPPTEGLTDLTDESLIPEEPALAMDFSAIAPLDQEALTLDDEVLRDMDLEPVTPVAAPEPILMTLEGQPLREAEALEMALDDPESDEIEFQDLGDGDAIAAALTHDLGIGGPEDLGADGLGMDELEMGNLDLDPVGEADDSAESAGFVGEWSLGDETSLETDGAALGETDFSEEEGELDFDLDQDLGLDLDAGLGELTASTEGLAEDLAEDLTEPPTEDLDLLALGDGADAIADLSADDAGDTADAIDESLQIDGLDDLTAAAIPSGPLDLGLGDDLDFATPEEETAGDNLDAIADDLSWDGDDLDAIDDATLRELPSNQDPDALEEWNDNLEARSLGNGESFIFGVDDSKDLEESEDLNALVTAELDAVRGLGLEAQELAQELLEAEAQETAFDLEAGTILPDFGEPGLGDDSEDLGEDFATNLPPGFTEGLTEGLTEDLPEDFGDNPEADELADALAVDLAADLTDDLTNDRATADLSPDLTADLESTDDLEDDLATDDLTADLANDLTNDLANDFDLSPDLTANLADELTDDLTDDLGEGLLDGLADGSSGELMDEWADEPQPLGAEFAPDALDSIAALNDLADPAGDLGLSGFEDDLTDNLTEALGDSEGFEVVPEEGLGELPAESLEMDLDWGTGTIAASPDDLTDDLGDLSDGLTDGAIAVEAATPDAIADFDDLGDLGDELASALGHDIEGLEISETVDQETLPLDLDPLGDLAGPGLAAIAGDDSEGERFPEFDVELGDTSEMQPPRREPEPTTEATATEDAIATDSLWGEEEDSLPELDFDPVSEVSDPSPVAAPDLEGLNDLDGFDDLGGLDGIGDDLDEGADAAETITSLDEALGLGTPPTGGNLTEAELAAFGALDLLNPEEAGADPFDAALLEALVDFDEPESSPVTAIDPELDAFLRGAIEADTDGVEKKKE
jgi:hypothetical protein